MSYRAASGISDRYASAVHVAEHGGRRDGLYPQEANGTKTVLCVPELNRMGARAEVKAIPSYAMA